MICCYSVQRCLIIKINFRILLGCCKRSWVLCGSLPSYGFVLWDDGSRHNALPFFESMRSKSPKNPKKTQNKTKTENYQISKIGLRSILGSKEEHQLSQRFMLGCLTQLAHARWYHQDGSSVLFFSGWPFCKSKLWYLDCPLSQKSHSALQSKLRVFSCL